MYVNKKENQRVLNLQVTDGLAVAVLRHTNHEFLMSTRDVAHGYGISHGTIRNHLVTHSSEFLLGKHFVKGADIISTLPSEGVQNLNALAGVQPHAVFWTKAGVVRLGFFIKSERAKLFRDWAEGLILQVLAPNVQLPVVAKRKHNRLNAERMVDILHDVCMIADAELRQRIANKLKGGQYNG